MTYYNIKFVFLALAGSLMMACSGSKKINYNKIFEGVNTEEYSALELVHMDDHFSTFAQFLDLAEMETGVLFNNDFTLFLPVNKAFNDMEVEEVERLLDPQNKMELRQFVDKYFLPRKVKVEDFEELQIIETAGEEEISVTTGITPEDVMIGGAYIVRPNIQASDGIIHITGSTIKSTEDVLP